MGDDVPNEVEQACCVDGGDCVCTKLSEVRSGKVRDMYTPSGPTAFTVPSTTSATPAILSHGTTSAMLHMT